VSGAGTNFDDVEHALVIFENALSVDLPGNVASFSQARLSLVKVVNGYMASEADSLARLRAAREDASLTNERVALHQALIDFKATYSTHIANWSSTDLKQNWSAYRSASVSLIIGMRKLLRRRATIVSGKVA
jgi:hypothetical protein